MSSNHSSVRFGIGKLLWRLAVVILFPRVHLAPPEQHIQHNLVPIPGSSRCITHTILLQISQILASTKLTKISINLGTNAQYSIYPLAGRVLVFMN